MQAGRGKMMHLFRVLSGRTADQLQSGLQLQLELQVHSTSA